MLAHTRRGATIYTDEAIAYGNLAHRKAINHSSGEYVRGQASINGIESFWSMLQRGYVASPAKVGML